MVPQILLRDGWLDTFRVYANLGNVSIAFRTQAFAHGIELIDSPLLVRYHCSRPELILASAQDARKKLSIIT